MENCREQNLVYILSLCFETFGKLNGSCSRTPSTYSMHWGKALVLPENLFKSNTRVGAYDDDETRSAFLESKRVCIYEMNMHALDFVLGGTVAYSLVGSDPGSIRVLIGRKCLFAQMFTAETPN